MIYLHEESGLQINIRIKIHLEKVAAHTFVTKRTLHTDGGQDVSLCDETLDAVWIDVGYDTIRVRRIS